MAARKIPAHGLAAGAIFLLVAGLTLFAWLMSSQRLDADARARFDAMATEVAEDIVDRLAVYEQVLRGGVGLFTASDQVSREEWRTYVENLRLEERFPGVQGVGFSLRIAPEEREKHIATLRAQGFPQYTIRPEGERPEYHSIIYLEPFTGRNLKAFGYDMFSEPTRRAAMERARDTGQTAVSGKVTLVQEAETQVQAGFLMYLPLYAKNQPRNSPSERQGALVGFVYSPFRMGDLLGTLLGAKDEKLRLRIFDGKKADAAAQLYDSLAGGVGGSHASRLTRHHAVDINGQPWFLEFSSRPAFEQSIDRHIPTLLLAAGLTISVLLFLVALSLGATRRRAQALAESMTAALQASEERTRRIVDTAHDGIITIDKAGLIQTANVAVERIFGWQASEMIGRNVKMLMPEPYHGEHDQYLRNYLETGQAKIIGIGREVKGLKRDGSIFSLELGVNEVRGANQHMFVGLLRDISERKAAEQEMLKVNEQLTMTVAALEKRDRELTLLTRMNDLLMACKDHAEAFKVIRISLGEIFRGLSGALAVKDSEGPGLQTVISWGQALEVQEMFGAEDCWAVRQGRLHDVADTEGGLVCAHVPQPPASGYICLPLMVQGSLLGVLTVEIWSSDPEAREADRRLIITVGETIKLSLSNLGLREALREQAIRDPLTKLYNRRFMEEAMAREVARAHRLEIPLTVAVVDVDFFKKVNDTYGHDGGDRVLREMGELLRKNLRGTDIPCRFGGEEFVVIMPETSLENAKHHFDDIRERFMALKIQHGSQSLGTITMSVGLAALPDQGEDGETVMLAADAALYAAKQGGRNRVVLASEVGTTAGG